MNSNLGLIAENKVGHWQHPSVVHSWLECSVKTVLWSIIHKQAHGENAFPRGDFQWAVYVPLNVNEKSVSERYRTVPRMTYLSDCRFHLGFVLLAFLLFTDPGAHPVSKQGICRILCEKCASDVGGGFSVSFHRKRELTNTESSSRVFTLCSLRFFWADPQ